MRMQKRSRGLGSISGVKAALQAGIAYCIKNNGTYDPITSVSFATGHSMEYWIIAQALANVGSNAAVNDAYYADIINESPQVSNNPAPGQNIALINVQSANALSSNIDNLYTDAGVMASAQNYVKGNNLQSQAVRTALGLAPFGATATPTPTPTPTPSVVAVSQPVNNVPPVATGTNNAVLLPMAPVSNTGQTAYNIGIPSQSVVNTVPTAGGSAYITDPQPAIQPSAASFGLSMPIIGLGLLALYFVTKKN